MGDLSPAQIQQILVGVFILVVSVALHEFGHAWMAVRLGDDTPRRQGRVTLNPLAHADPIGTLLLPVVGGYYAASSGVAGGFGWGKPVEWQPHKIRRGIRMSTANILVSFAGPFMNLVLATIVVGVHSVLVWKGVITLDSKASLFLYQATATNFILFFFNLLPLPPLDGGHIAGAFVPYRHRTQWDQIARFAPFAILAVMLIPQVAQVFRVPAMWCTKGLYGAFGVIPL
ncbi:MAG: site-2 protease family protein [Deltaproteobacteria bacterium]|nr:site-2 protease family protein [Deltaproteobacteria bacterium]